MEISNIDTAYSDAVQLYQQQRLDEASAICQQILAVDQNRTEVLNLAGLLAIAAHDYLHAENLLRKALALDPESIFTHNNLGLALYELRQFAQAAELFKKVLSHDPNNPYLLNNLGETLNNLNRHEEALQYCQKAVQLAPNSVEARQTLGVTYYNMGRFHETLEQYNLALSINDGDAVLHTIRASVRLLLGDFAHGWKEYEHRNREPHAIAIAAKAPEWDGSSIEGKTILVHFEQGIGDNIHFVRYLPLLHQRGAKVIFVCRPDMFNLFACMDNITLIRKDDPLPAFDVHCRLMSLPHKFGTTVDTIPAQTGYLQANDAKSNDWHKRIAAIPGRKIGIVWAGNPKHSNDARRSMDFSQLAPLLDIPGITFVTLQLGTAAEQARNHPLHARLIDWTDQLSDLSDTAALISNLDLIISVDSALAHLSAALGKPVWTMLPFIPEFRWMLSRPDTPWYPTMRLFRQPTRGDWPSIIQSIAQQLQLKT